MGGYEIYCHFCLGPLDDAREAWLREVRNWENNSDLSFTPPPAPTEDIVTITEEDGKSWEDFVAVSDCWDNFVSPKCAMENDTGVFSAGGSLEWQFYAEDFLVFHRQCLSFLTRRINATPKEIWESFFRPSDGGVAPGNPSMFVDYYDMDKRAGQYFSYAIDRNTPRQDGKKGSEWWSDPSTMLDLQWILARPGIFPLVKPLSITVTPSTSSVQPISFCMKVFQIPEMFGLILDAIINIGETTQGELIHEMEADTLFTRPSVTEATRTIFSFLQVNKQVYLSIVRDRQDVFLRLAWEHGWMLPSTPWEWKNWQNGTFHDGNSFVVEKDADWRAYLLSFLRKEDVHIKNRWRFHRMTVQFAIGNVRWDWFVGDLGVRTEVAPPKPLAWEET